MALGFGGFVCTLTAPAAASLLLLVPHPPSAAAAPSDRGLEELWQEFPLDPLNAGSGAPAVDGAPDDAADGPADATEDRPPRRRAPATSASARSSRGDGADADSRPTMLAVVVAVAGVAVLLVMGFPGGVPLGRRRGAPPLPGRVAAQPAAARVLDDLLHAVRPAPARLETEEVSAVTPRSPLDVWSDAQSREAPQPARPRQPAPSDVVKPDARAEPEALKRTHAATDATALKAKVRELDVPPKASLADAAVLKEKLARASDEEVTRALKPRAAAPRARTAGQHQQESALRPVPTPGTEAPRAAPPAGRECEVRRWRGYVKSQFVAVCTNASGAETSVGASPYFRWPGADHPETATAAAALRALVDSLEREGWRVVGRGDAWFSMRLREESDGVASSSGQRGR